MSTSSASEGNKMVEVAIDLLFDLVENGGKIGTREIGRKYNINSTSGQRIVTTLREKHCLRYNDEAQKYELGFGILRLAKVNFAERFSLIEFAKPYMERLRDETDETVMVHTMVGDYRICVYKVESRRQLRWTSEIGKLVPMTAGASSKAILPLLSREELDNIMRNLPDDKKRALLEEIEVVKKRGFAVSRSEIEPGGVGISTSLKTDSVYASLSIYGPVTRLTEETIEKYGRMLTEEVKQLQEQFELMQGN